MKKILTLSVLCALAMNVQAQSKKSAFFVGNSYTSYNNLPQLVANIAATTNDTLVHSSHTPGGNLFFQHANNSTVLNNLALGTWDFVVLQEQSQMPAFPQAQVENEMFFAAESLVNSARAGNACVTPIFYMTWGRKNGDASLCNQGLRVACTYEGMDSMIALRYTQVAELNEALLSPVGRVWRAIRTQYPNYELYTADESHPSLLGSMAAAYTFYTIMFEKDPTLSNYNHTNLDDTQEANIKNIVKTVVFDELQTWYVGEHNHTANFTFDIQNNGTVAFNNTSNKANTFEWNFGDGNTSTDENPIHTFRENGIYEISLTTGDCDKTITQFVEITNIETVSVHSLVNSALKVYPNPSENNINIEGLEDLVQIQLYNIDGKIMPISFTKNNSILQINLSDIANGIYFLQCLEKENNTTIKIIKQ